MGRHLDPKLDEGADSLLEFLLPSQMNGDFLARADVSIGFVPKFFQKSGEEFGGGGEEVPLNEEKAIHISPILAVQCERHLQQGVTRCSCNLEFVRIFQDQA